MPWYTAPNGVAHWADDDNMSSSTPFTICDLHVIEWRNGDYDAASHCDECVGKRERLAETTRFR